MKRNRIGDTDIDLSLPYWSAGKDTHQLRTCEIELYAHIDLLQEEANLLTDDIEIQTKYNQMDMYFACLKIIEAYGTQPDLLKQAAVVLNSHILKGRFSKTYTDLDERNENVNALIAVIIENAPDNTLAYNFDNEFLVWFNDTVIEQNYYCNPQTGQRSNQAITPTIGATSTYDTFSSKIKESGCYWLYTQVKETTDFNDTGKWKLAQQYQYVDWVLSCNIGMNRASVNANIQSGILNKTGKNATDNLTELKNSAVAGSCKIGIGIEIVVSIVMAVIALANLVIAIIKVCNPDKYAGAPTTAMQEATAPTGTDFFNSGAATDTTDTGIVEQLKSSPIAWVAGAALLYALFS